MARVARTRNQSSHQQGDKMKKETTPNSPENIPTTCHHCPNTLNSRFTLSVIAVILSCFTGLWTIPLALAALILSLRAQDLAQATQWEEAKNTAWWAGLFGWLTIVIALIPVILVILFGGTILAFFAAVLAAAA